MIVFEHPQVVKLMVMETMDKKKVFMAVLGFVAISYKFRFQNDYKKKLCY